MDDVKKAYAWQEAIELSRQLAAVCEEFRDPESNVLVWHLRHAVVDVPAGVAADLQAQRSATMEPMVKLATALELVQRIYPGVEIGDVEEKFAKLWERMSGSAFADREPEPEPEEMEAEEVSEEADVAPAKPEKAAAKVKVDGVSQSAVAEAVPAKDQE